MANKAGKKLRSNDSPGIFIYGPLRLQNELMGQYLEDTVGLSCSDITNADLEKMLNHPRGETALILLDCQGTSPAGLWPKIRDISEAEANSLMIALFNVASGHQIRNDLVNCGVRGVFFQDDPLANLGKGINAILNGELWKTKRQILSFRRKLANRFLDYF